MERIVFNSEIHQQQFKSEGYVIVDLLTAQEVVELRQIYDELYPPGISAGFHCTLYLEDEALKKAVNDRVKAFIMPKIQGYLKNYKGLVADFTVKEPSTDKRVSIHQDWSFVDESKFVSLNCWTPLVDTNSVNGSYYIVRRSNQIKPVKRGSNIPLPCGKITKKVKFDYLKYLPMKAGQSIIYDHQLMHCTPANRSTEKRLALSMSVIPEEATAIHYYMDRESGKVNVYEIDETFFYKYKFDNSTHINSMPEGFKLLGVVENYEDVFFTEDDIMGLYENPTLKHKLKQFVKNAIG